MRSFRKKQGTGAGEGPLRRLSAPGMVAEASQERQDWGSEPGRGLELGGSEGSWWEHTHLCPCL